MKSEYNRPPIRVALMGLGRAMIQEHYAFYKEHPSLFKIVAACDISKERRDMVMMDFPECKMFRQYRDMLDERDIEMVDIATCSVDHVQHAMMSLERGLWTVVESPLALSVEEVQLIRGASQKAKNRLIVVQRGLFDPDFLLTKQVMGDSRIGEVYELRLRNEDFVRRDDWLTVKRLGGGASFYAMNDLVLQALKLLPSPPVQMWSELKRIVSLGDAEDYAHICLKTRAQVSVDMEYNGAVVAENRGPSFMIRGERGQFSVMPGASEGMITVIDPKFKFPRRRSSVRTPDMSDLHEEIPVVSIPVSLRRGTECGQQAFWRHIYETIRTAAPFPISLDESIEALKFSHLMKKTSPFGK